MKSCSLLRLCIIIQFIAFSLNLPAQEPSFTMDIVGYPFLVDNGWDLNYGPDDYLWVTERTDGIVVRIDPETGDRDEILEIPDISSTAGQDGLLGLAFHEQFSTDSPFVYLSYTWLNQGSRTQRLVRYTYSMDGEHGMLSDPLTLIDFLPASNDHNSGRLVFGPDGKLYYTIGDQGANQGGNYCNPNLAQVLPTQEEIDAQDWSNYPGKVLRLNTDGSIPEDNPMLEGVRSHIYSYGHRNPQGLVFGSNGLLYSDEHGPNTDDEVNIIYNGGNYGWPNIAGYQDDQAYDYCNWSSAANCQSERYSNGSCPSTAAFLTESSFFAENYQEPLMSMFAVSDDYDFNNPACDDDWICRPNVAPSSIGIYESDAIPAWKNSLLVVSLKRGRIFRLQLDESGTTVIGDTTQHFYTTNRYRDIAIAPDGKTIYIMTDESGKTSGPSGLTLTRDIQNPASILKFTLQESTPVEPLASVDFLKVWPNPASDQLSIALKTGISSTTVGQLINASGRVIATWEQLVEGTHQYSIQDVPAGFYVLKVSNDQGSWNHKIVINK